MKTNSPLKQNYFVVVVMLLFALPSIKAQTLYALKIDHKIRFEARDITALYQPRLVMGMDQAMEFQSTIARFLVKKQAVEQDHTLSPKAKYELLKQVSSRENSEMANVLESYRWQEYIRLKPQLQPIPLPDSMKPQLLVQD
jgi:hypothetical protein